MSPRIPLLEKAATGSKIDPQDCRLGEINRALAMKVGIAGSVRRPPQSIPRARPWYG